MKTRSAVAFVLVAIFVVSSVAAALTPRSAYATKPPVLAPPVLSPRLCKTIGGTWAANTCTITSYEVTSNFWIPPKATLLLSGPPSSSGKITIDIRVHLTNYGMINSTAVILNHGTITNWRGGTIVNTAGFITNYRDATINNYGNMTTLGTESTPGNILNEGRINNYLRGVINIRFGGSLDNYGHGTINNRHGGTITINSGGKIYNYGSFDNSGIIDNCGTINNYGNFDNKRILNNPGMFVNRGTGDFYNEEHAIVNNSEEIRTHFISCGGFLDEGTWNGVYAGLVTTCPLGYDGNEPCVPCTCPENFPDYCPCTECGPAP